MNRTRTIRSPLQRSERVGFTLVEMLVAITLVLLMMVMFGEIFQIATGSVTRQRIMADNDQNARTFVTVFRADVDKRTFRTLVPFFPEELSTNPGTPFNPRRGYFSIACNNPTDGTDDVLSFTTLVTISVRNADESPYYGRGIPLFAGAGGTPALNFLANPNQPDRDDGQITSNFAASSKAAEVSYFMRGKRLYRRVQLLRDPIPSAGVDPSNPSQPGFLNPATGATVEYFLPGGIYDTQATAAYGSIGFWRDFDFSASRTPTSISVYAPSLPINARFHGMDSLSNDKTELPYTPHPWMPALGQTWNRFGHNHQIVLALPLGTAPVNTNGLPREYTTATPSGAIPLAFIGRFTQEETSKTATAAFPSNFGYPQALSVAPTAAPGAWNGNPMDAAGTELTLDPITGAVNEFQPNSAYSRPGVDLLLSNVHEFRVELWDERLGQFVVPGHALTDTAPGDDGIFGTADDTAPGDYAGSRQLNGTYGPLGPATDTAFSFDTWHPLFNRNANFINDALGNPQPVLNDASDRPPYRPLKYAPANTIYSNAAPVPWGPSGPFPASPTGPYQPSYWAPGTQYSVGNVVFPRTEDLNANGVLDAGEDGSCGFAAEGLPTPNPKTPFNSSSSLKFAPFGLTYAYRCVTPGTSGTLLSSEPSWRTTPGSVFGGNPADIDANGNGVVDAGDTDYNGNGILDPAEPGWICEYNVRPLRAIRVTVRFEHPTSKQMKQITVVHSLRDTTSVP